MLIKNSDSINPSNAEANFPLEHKNGKTKLCHVGIHWIVCAKYFQISTHVPGFQSSFSFFFYFCIGKISQQHKV